MDTNTKLLTIPVALAVGIVLAAGINGITEKDVALMTREGLREAISEGPVVILDARNGKDWHSSEFKIKGAVRADPKRFSDWVERHPKHAPVVVYCA
jgi:predicted sulfurtransferase